MAKAKVGGRQLTNDESGRIVNCRQSIYSISSCRSNSSRVPHLQGTDQPDKTTNQPTPQLCSALLCRENKTELRARPDPARRRRISILSTYPPIYPSIGWSIHHTKLSPKLQPYLTMAPVSSPSRPPSPSRRGHLDLEKASARRHPGPLLNDPLSRHYYHHYRRGRGRPPPSGATCMRHFCLLVFFALLAFVAWLFRFAWSPSAAASSSAAAAAAVAAAAAAGGSRAGLGVEVGSGRPYTWERFDRLEPVYGGVRSLRVVGADGYGSQQQQQQKQEDGGDGLRTISSGEIYDPYPDQDYASSSSSTSTCPLLMADGRTVDIPPVRFHRARVPAGFPPPAYGSPAVVGAEAQGAGEGDAAAHGCFDRYGRLGPYGLGYDARVGGIGAGLYGDREGMDSIWASVPRVDYRGARWGETQARCVEANQERFGFDVDDAPGQGAEATPGRRRRLSRAVFLVRTFSGYEYNAESILFLRSLVAELSLRTGGQFIVHFLIHVTDETLPIWSDPDTYAHVLAASLPTEFAGMGTLWSERQMALLYPGLGPDEDILHGHPVYGVERDVWLPVLHFAVEHPEFEYVWHWHMDARYSGHWFRLVDRAAAWTRSQPRKGLWERGGRFYVPGVHGSWEDFGNLVHSQVECGSRVSPELCEAVKRKDIKTSDKERLLPPREKPVWGPVPLQPDDFVPMPDIDTYPSTSYESDGRTWGIGEEADLITFNPLFDPAGTSWPWRGDASGYNATVSANDPSYPPRRASVGTTSGRLSRRLLLAMHREATDLTRSPGHRHRLFSDMWPPTVALHHGLKAVFVPHPVWTERAWPSDYLDAVLNSGRNGAASCAQTAVLGGGEHNFWGMTWFHHRAEFASKLWRRWLGASVSEGGSGSGSVRERVERAERAEGRMCLPAMLLYPVRDVRLAVEDGDSLV